jgi:hypothetical protein
MSLRSIPLEPEGTATRTDSLKYIQYNGVQLQDLVIDQTVKLPWKLYGRGEVGYMEPAYGGVDLELYRPFAGGAFGLGVQYQNVQKRRVDDWFAFEKTRFEGKFVNLFADLVPELGIKTTAKVGQFFAGDKGVSLTLLRKYKYFTLGAFVTKTTTDMFKSQENQGYMDKGVFMNIPISTIAHRKNSKGASITASNLGRGMSPNTPTRSTRWWGWNRPMSMRCAHKWIISKINDFCATIRANIIKGVNDEKNRIDSFGFGYGKYECICSSRGCWWSSR